MKILFDLAIAGLSSSGVSGAASELALGGAATELPVGGAAEEAAFAALGAALCAAGTGSAACAEAEAADFFAATASCFPCAHSNSMRSINQPWDVEQAMSQ